MVFTCSIFLVLSLTTGVLYWNYTETLGDKQSKAVVLDHWGKGSPTEQELRSVSLTTRPHLICPTGIFSEFRNMSAGNASWRNCTFLNL